MKITFRFPGVGHPMFIVRDKRTQKIETARTPNALKTLLWGKSLTRYAVYKKVEFDTEDCDVIASIAKTK